MCGWVCHEALALRSDADIYTNDLCAENNVSWSLLRSHATPNFHASHNKHLSPVALSTVSVQLQLQLLFSAGGCSCAANNIASLCAAARPNAANSAGIRCQLSVNLDISCILSGLRQPCKVRWRSKLQCHDFCVPPSPMVTTAMLNSMSFAIIYLIALCMWVQVCS